MLESCDAFNFVRDNPDCDIEKYQEIACKSPAWSFYFARDIPDANISYCQKHAVKRPVTASAFAMTVAESDIEYSYKSSGCSSRESIKRFVMVEL